MRDPECAVTIRVEKEHDELTRFKPWRSRNLGCVVIGSPTHLAQNNDPRIQWSLQDAIDADRNEGNHGEPGRTQSGFHSLDAPFDDDANA